MLQYSALEAAHVPERPNSSMLAARHVMWVLLSLVMLESWCQASSHVSHYPLAAHVVPGSCMCATVCSRIVCVNSTAVFASPCHLQSWAMCSACAGRSASVTEGPSMLSAKPMCCVCRERVCQFLCMPAPLYLMLCLLQMPTPSGEQASSHPGRRWAGAES